MAEQQRATLHGVWASAFCRRVELALQIEGMPYQHVEEDLAHKSTLLLKYNPVYKKVPVLVHDGKPIAESLVILEFIDETWKNIGPLLPEDPFKRSFQEEILGTKIIDPEKYQLIFSWVTALNEITLEKELNPPHEKLLALLLSDRNHNLKSGAA